MDAKILEKYAELIVKTGINLQKGQYVVIRTGVFLEDFAALVSKKCYEAGAKKVFVNWQSSKLSAVDYNCGDEEVLSEVPSFEEEIYKFLIDKNPVLIWLDGDDPDGLKGIDAAKAARIRAKRLAVIGKYKKARDNKFQWTIVGVPSKEWAKKVFPALEEDEAIEALWKAILETSRAIDGNGEENWIKHNDNLKERCEHLNKLRLKKLHYTSKNGTDLTVGLIPGVIFMGGGEETLDGTFFNPNIPSEECFTSPKKGEAEGIVYSTKPLVYNGQLIEDFSVRFHEGKAVEVHAKRGQEVLEGILAIDEGASYLGECALVPFHSPINDTGILFYNTLFDENASCHLALGMGFTNLYPNYEKYTDKELEDFGINSSHSHVDFMIGSEDLTIVGTTENDEEVLIFKDGDWAF